MQVVLDFLTEPASICIIFEEESKQSGISWEEMEEWLVKVILEVVCDLVLPDNALALRYVDQPKPVMISRTSSVP